jgi:hypothetical protein
MRTRSAANVLLVAVLLSAPPTAVAQDQAAAPDAGAQIINQNLTSESADTPTPTPTPSATPTPTPTLGGGSGATPTPTPTARLSQGNNAIQQPSQVKKAEADSTRCLPHPSRMLARGGITWVNPPTHHFSAWALGVAAVCAAVALVAYALRRRRTHQVGDRVASSEPASLLEVVATVVGILAGVGGIAAAFVPGVAPHQRPSPAATMRVEAINARVTRFEFARSLGLDDTMNSVDRREVGNVIWLQMHLTGYRDTRLVLQWGSYDISRGPGGPLVAATVKDGLRIQPESDDLSVIEPIWVGYPDVKRFRVGFRLLDRAQVRELASTGAMIGDVPRYQCRSTA